MIETSGDHTLSMFDWPRDALRAAIQLRNTLRTDPWFLNDDRPPVRMAIHSGRTADPTSTRTHLGSVALHCVLLCNSAAPWQILVSHATEALLTENQQAMFTLRGLGERTLASLQHPVHVFEVDVEPQRNRGLP